MKHRTNDIKWLKTVLSLCCVLSLCIYRKTHTHTHTRNVIKLILYSYLNYNRQNILLSKLIQICPFHTGFYTWNLKEITLTKGCEDFHNNKYKVQGKMSSWFFFFLELNGILLNLQKTRNLKRKPENRTCCTKTTGCVTRNCWFDWIPGGLLSP